MRSAVELLDELNAVDESARIEAKRASDIGKSVMETVIAFANEPGLDGGYLLLGVDWSLNDKGDTVYRPVGFLDPDKVQRNLASQCASMLNVTLRPEMQLEQVDGKTLLVVYVPEADVTHKPIYKKATGLPGGAYRRIGSSDQRCVDEDLWVLRGESQPLHGPDSSVLSDARLDDFDPSAIAAYRRDRARINPQAEELAYGDEDMLEALGAVRRMEGALQPTLAGIVLFGKPLALRRLLPMVRIDYIRVPGTEWVEDPENRFQSIDIRKPLLLALPQAEASIIDELPKGFRLPEGQLQSVQEPILPRKVIREALANAAMHRNYTLHSPTQIIRYSNRIEIRNVGYSLKEPAQLGLPGSRLRNPAIAAVLHDLHLAEAKGTGIRAMRRLAADAGLPLPEFHSDRQANEFRLTLFLHNLLTEEDHTWLRNYAGSNLGPDEAKVLIYVRATGAVDNTACRDFCGSDTLTASQVLRRLRDRGLLLKQGAGSRTYYVLNSAEHAPLPETVQPELPLGIPTSLAEDVGISLNPHKLDSGSPQALVGISAELRQRIQVAGQKPRKATVRELLRELCALRPYTAQDLSQILGRKDSRELTRTHLKPMREAGILTLLYPESEKHPHQAYRTVREDKEQDANA
ncbi:putative DNA binding domain-containing protein [Pseudomonas sp. ABC1]|uniref:ATP-binding protein n=1 Tax=Pseudomonas sp. ABC1 TaxID=2748080 RepID=UPI0015C307CA|nr:RNA-binding domain-containing protein [Pseudomonas sp. ABC1]QLF93739.1 putative DNA binding domain-containing protein [Pseudomonas sp. ABC1]